MMLDDPEPAKRKLQEVLDKDLATRKRLKIRQRALDMEIEDLTMELL